MKRFFKFVIILCVLAGIGFIGYKLYLRFGISAEDYTITIKRANISVLVGSEINYDDIVEFRNKETGEKVTTRNEWIRANGNTSKVGSFEIKYVVGGVVNKSTTIVKVIEGTKVTADAKISQDKINEYYARDLIYSNIDYGEDNVNVVINRMTGNSLAKFVFAHEFISFAGDLNSLDYLITVNYLIDYYSALATQSESPETIKTTIDGKTIVLPYVMYRYDTSANFHECGKVDDTSIVFPLANENVSYDEFVKSFESFLIDNDVDGSRTIKTTVYGTNKHIDWSIDIVEGMTFQAYVSELRGHGAWYPVTTDISEH